MRFQRNAVIGLAVLGGTGIVGWQVRGTAAPAKLVPAKPLPPRPDAPRAVSTSPSVRHAALLKYYPPPGWIQHYLGDDRYKIDGRIWHVVSTQNDTYYHRPDCPNMLRQSADIVLGFPTGEDAVEAGYKPDPVCHPEEPVIAYAGAMPNMPRMNLTPGSNGSAVTLADGTSTVTLPAGWQRIRTARQNFQGQATTIDIFTPGPAKPGVMVLKEMAPSTVNLNTYLTPKGFRTQWQGNNGILNSTGTVNSTLDSISKFNAKSTTVGGLPGLLLIPKAGPGLPTMPGSLYVVHRGQQAFIIIDGTKGGPGANSLLRSFRFR